MIATDYILSFFGYYRQNENIHDVKKNPEDSNQSKEQNKIPEHEEQKQQLTSKFEILSSDLKKFVKNPDSHILTKPGKAIAYTLVIKIISLIIAFVFPCLGWLMIGCSIGIFDRVILLNLKTFFIGTFENIGFYFHNFIAAFTGAGKEQANLTKDPQQKNI